MTDNSVFFVKALVQGSNPPVYQYVAAEYLAVKGSNVVDPYWSTVSANNANTGNYTIYSQVKDPATGVITYESSAAQNTNGYYIVQAGFSPDYSSGRVAAMILAA